VSALSTATAGARWRTHPSAICERAAFPVQTKRIRITARLCGAPKTCRPLVDRRLFHHPLVSCGKVVQQTVFPRATLIQKL
jgi:hypothetical protein